MAPLSFRNAAPMLVARVAPADDTIGRPVGAENKLVNL